MVLAAGKTLASLFEGLPDNAHGKQVREFLKSLPGVDLNTGLAQLPLAGIRAAEMLVATPGFQALLQDVYSKVKIIHNGTVEAVELDVWSSGCGGTGGPGGGPLAKKIADQPSREEREGLK